jgi:hypothetical protein
MIDQHYIFQEILDLSEEIVSNAMDIRELIACHPYLTDVLEKRAEYLYKITMDFKYKAHDVIKSEERK